MSAVGNAIKISGQTETDPLPPPILGGDTHEILRSLLGYDEARIATLEASGALGAILSTGSER
jgi:crotonobetainyl-CoA:carnitine CoA-transferase CaiB-like acyl-CoA transferase